MAEPKVRFKRDDGSIYPDWIIEKMGSLTREYKVRNKTKLPLEIYSVNNEVGFLPQSEQFEDAGYLNDTDTSIYMIVPPNHFAYNPARINIGSIGYQNVGHDVQVSSLYEVFRTTKEVNDRFLWYWFHTPIFNKAVIALQEGGVRLYYYYEKLKETSISLPCLEEQQKIADFLSNVDGVIAACTEKVANLETQKKAVMKKIFSQEVRFKNANGSDFPEWEEGMVGDYLSDITYGFTNPMPDADDGPWKITAKDIVDGRICYETARHTTEDAYCNDLTDKSRPIRDDILLTKDGTLGRVAIVRDDVKICINQSVALLRLKDNSNVNPLFFMTMLMSPVYQEKMIADAGGGTIKHIYITKVDKMMCAIPCLEEQRLIADFLSDFDEAIAAAKKELELWKELKKGLLQQMFV